MTGGAIGYRARARRLAPLLAAGVAATCLAVYYELDVYLPTLNTKRTLLEDVPHRASELPHPPGLARRLAVILVDGLSYDAARTLDELGPLRRAGVLRSLAVEFPSFTSPALVSMVTGLGPRDSGTRRNGDLAGTVGLDTLMMALGDAKVPVRLFGRSFADQAKILVPPEGSSFYPGWFAPAVDLGRRGLAGADPPGFDGKSPVRSLDWIHWGEVDEVGHRHGSASPLYREEAVNAARYVARYAANLDLDQDALVVMSDHGHTRKGGHGGDEAEVSHALFLGVGSIFRQGVELGERPMRDVASTLAVLAGVRVPSSNLGLPMLDAISIGDRETSFLLAAPFDEAMRFLCTLHDSPRCAEVPALVTALSAAASTAPAKGDVPAWEKAVTLYAAIDGERERDLAERGRREAVRRLITASLALVATMVAGFFARRRILRGVPAIERPRLGWQAALTPLVLAATYVAFMAYRGYRPSFSNLMPIPIFATDATPAGFVAVVAVALFAWLSRASEWAGWALLVGTVAPFAVLVASVGADTMLLPANVPGALVFLLGPLVPTAAFGAVVLAALSEVRRRG